MPKTENKLAKFKDSATDFPLIDRALAGDSLAYEEIFNRYRYRILSLFLRFTNNNFADSEDLLQETFVQAFNKLHSFKRESGFYTWLHPIAANTFFMACRRKKINTQPIDEIFDQQTADKKLVIQEVYKNNDGDVSIKGDIGRLDPKIENIPSKILVHQLLNKLSPGYRKVLELIYLQGFDGVEAACTLGCSEGNIKSQRHKAVHKLRAMC